MQLGMCTSTRSGLLDATVTLLITWGIVATYIGSTITADAPLCGPAVEEACEPPALEAAGKVPLSSVYGAGTARRLAAGASHWMRSLAGPQLRDSLCATVQRHADAGPSVLRTALELPGLAAWSFLVRADLPAVALVLVNMLLIAELAAAGTRPHKHRAGLLTLHRATCYAWAAAHLLYWLPASAAAAGATAGRVALWRANVQVALMLQRAAAAAGPWLSLGFLVYGLPCVVATPTAVSAFLLTVLLDRLVDAQYSSPPVAWTFKPWHATGLACILAGVLACRSLEARRRPPRAPARASGNEPAGAAAAGASTDAGASGAAAVMSGRSSGSAGMLGGGSAASAGAAPGERSFSKPTGGRDAAKGGRLEDTAMECGAVKAQKATQSVAMPSQATGTPEHVAASQPAPADALPTALARMPADVPAGGAAAAATEQRAQATGVSVQAQALVQPVVGDKPQGSFNAPLYQSPATCLVFSIKVMPGGQVSPVVGGAQAQAAPLQLAGRAPGAGSDVAAVADSGTGGLVLQDGGEAFQVQAAAVRAALQSAAAEVASSAGLQVLRTSVATFPGCIHALLAFMVAGVPPQQQEEQGDVLLQQLLGALQGRLPWEARVAALQVAPIYAMTSRRPLALQADQSAPAIVSGDAREQQQGPAPHTDDSSWGTRHGIAGGVRCSPPTIWPVALPQQRASPAADSPVSNIASGEGPHGVPDAEGPQQDVWLLLPEDLRQQLLSSRPGGRLRVVITPDSPQQLPSSCCWSFADGEWQLAGLPAKVLLDLPEQLRAAGPLLQATVLAAPAEGRAHEHVLAQLPLLVLPQAACIEMCNMFAWMTAEAGSAVAAYHGHFVPLARDLSTVLQQAAALTRPAYHASGVAHVAGQLRRFLAASRMEASLQLLDAAELAGGVVAAADCRPAAVRTPHPGRLRRVGALAATAAAALRLTRRPAAGAPDAGGHVKQNKKGPAGSSSATSSHASSAAGSLASCAKKPQQDVRAAGLAAAGLAVPGRLCLRDVLCGFQDSPTEAAYLRYKAQHLVAWDLAAAAVKVTKDVLTTRKASAAIKDAEHQVHFVLWRLALLAGCLPYLAMLLHRRGWLGIGRERYMLASRVTSAVLAVLIMAFPGPKRTFLTHMPAVYGRLAGLYAWVFLAVPALQQLTVRVWAATVPCTLLQATIVTHMLMQAATPPLPLVVLALCGCLAVEGAVSAGLEAGMRWRFARGMAAARSG